jgi:gliding motility-associated-like protein
MKYTKLYIVSTILVFHFLISFQSVQAQINCTVNAGSSITWCGSQGIRLDGHVAGVIQGQTIWQQISGIPVVIENPDKLQAHILPPLAQGTYVFELTAICGQGFATQQVTHIVESSEIPDAGPDIIVPCYTSGFIPLQPKNVPTLPFIAEWSVVSGEGIVSDNKFYPNIQVNSCPPANGYILQYSFINKNGCRQSDLLNINIEKFLPDIKIKTGGGGCGGAAYALGTCPGNKGTVQWKFLSPAGGGGATFTSPFNMLTNFTNLKPGTQYIIEYSVSNSTCGTKSKIDTFIASKESKFGTYPNIDVKGFEKFTYQDQSAVVICGDIPDTLLFSGNLPNFPNGEKVTWNINSTSCDIWTLTVKQAKPTLIELSKTQVALVNLKFGFYELTYTIESGEACALAEKIIIAVLPDGEDVSFYSSNNCSNQDFSKYNIKCRLTIGLEYVMNDAYYHFPIPKEIIPIIKENINYIADGIEFLPVNNSNTRAFADMCYNNTTHEYQYFINLRKDAPAGKHIYEIPIVYGKEAIPSCNGSKARFIIDLSKPAEIARGGTDQLICGNYTGLAGNTVKSPEWTFFSVDPPNASFPVISTPNSIVTDVDNLDPDATYKFLYKSIGGEFCGSSYDTVTVKTAQLSPPQPNAGVDLKVCSGAAIRLSAKPSPLPPGVEGIWKVVMPIGAELNFSDPSNPNTIVSGFLPNTNYVLRFTLRNGCLLNGKSDEISIMVSGNLGVNTPNAGNDKCLPSGITSINLAADSPSPTGAKGVWVQSASNPSGATLNNPNSEITTVSGLRNGTYKFIWIVSLAPCASQSDSVTITIGGTKAEVLQSVIKICNQQAPQSVYLEAKPAIGGMWMQIDGITGVNITNPNNAITNVSGLQPGIYKFLWKVENGICSSSKEVEVRVGKILPVSNAGTDAIYCPKDSIIRLNAFALSPGYFAYWSVEPFGPNIPSAGVDFLNPNDITNPYALVKLKPGRTKLRWNIVADPLCGDQPSIDDVIIDYIPDARLKYDTMKLCDAHSVQLVSTYPGEAAQATWRQISGPTVKGLPHIMSESKPIILGLNGYGIYVFEYCVNSKDCPQNCDQITVINSAPFKPFIIKEKEILCIKNEILLKGANLPSGYTARWEYIKGPVPLNDIKFNPSSEVNETTVTPVQVGTYHFRYIVSNGACELSSTILDSVRIGKVDAGPDIAICSQNTVKLSTAPIGYRWNFESSGFGNVVIDPSSGLISDLDSVGTYFFKLTAPNGCYDVVKIDKIGTGITYKINVDSIKTCVGGNQVFSVLATASFGNINYQWQQSSTGLPSDFINIASSSDNYFPQQSVPGITYYRVLLTNTENNCTDTSRIVPVEVIADPIISTISRDTGACQGASIKLIATVQGGYDKLNYVWENSTFSTGPWTAIANANSLNYNITTSSGVKYYRLNFSSTGNHCNTALSKPIKVSIDSQATISIGAMDLAVCVGAKDSFKIEGNSGLVEWQTSTNPMGPFIKVGNSNRNIALNTNIAGNFYYKAILLSSNGYCNDTDAVVKLTVVPDPVLALLSRDTGICEGNSIMLNAIGEGGLSPLIYQWQSSGTRIGPWNDIQGANNPQFNPNLLSGTQFYRLKLSSIGKGCNDALTNEVEVKVDPKPVIIADLQDKILCVGGIDTLKLSANGSNFNYEWRSSTSITGPYANSGINSPELIPLSNQIGDRYYFVAISSTNNFCKDTSRLAKVSIVADPRIEVEPRDTVICPGKKLILTAAALQGIAPLLYQWQSASSSFGPWYDISAANQGNLDINTNQSGTFYYRMVAKSYGQGCEDAVSRIAEIKINATVSITTSPIGYTACVGSQRNLFVTAAGNTHRFQWQMSHTGSNNWIDILGATNSSYTPVSIKNDTIYYRCVVIDTQNSDCGSDTSKVAQVIIHTEFGLNIDTIEVCGTNDGVQSTTLNFNRFIRSGDPNPTWSVIGSILPIGPWSAKDFTGIPSGTIIRFVATTTDQQAPCLNISDTIVVKVILCCPSICTKPPDAVLCNQSQAVFNLQQLVCSSTQAGSWSILSGPGIIQQEFLTNGILTPSKYQAGVFKLQYRLNNSFKECQDTSIQFITIAKIPEAGIARQTVIRICENQDTIINLNAALLAQDLGGSWRSDDIRLQSLIDISGRVNLATLQNGNYKVRYVVVSKECGNDSSEIELFIDKAPFVDAGKDGRLSCDTPTLFIGNNLNSSGQNVEIKWTLIGGVINDPVNPRLEVSTPGRYLLEIQDKISGCKSIDTVDVIAGETFIKNVSSISKDPPCYGEKNAIIEVTDIKGGTAPFAFVLLDQGSKELSRNSTGKFVSLSPGKYTIRIEDKNGCITTRTYEIVEPAPLDVVLLRDTTISCRDSVYLEVQTGIDPRRISELKWYGDGTLIDTLAIYNRTLHPQNTTRYSIRVRDNNGCFVESAATVKVDLQAHVYAPNVFSPNGDNLNDLFKLVYSENVDYIFSFAIYDRWGEQMYSKQNFYPTDEHGWNGIFQAQNCNPGVFVWVAKIRACDDRIETIYGDVTLLR